MTAPFDPGGDTVTVWRAPLVPDGRYGKLARDWTAGVSTVVRGVSVQPISNAEADVDREWASTHMRMFAPYRIDLESTDRVEWHGQMFEVDGQPARWCDDVGTPDHAEVDIKRMTG